MPRPFRVATLFFALGLLGCTHPSSTHLLIVVVDALRADHLHCHGYTRPTSPRLDALAADGTRFRNAVTSSPWTLPALATLMTSLYPSVHGAIRPSDVMRVVLSGGRVPPVDALDDSRTTLAEVLHAAGFRTAAFVSGAYPGRVFGFAQGFERFDQAPSVRTNVTSFLDWLDRERPARFFAYLHVGEVHGPYTPPDPDALPGGTPDDVRGAVAGERARYASVDFDPGYDGPADGSLANLQAIRTKALLPTPRDVEHLAALYDRGIAYVDGWIGQLLDELARRKLLDRTILLVTADHGEELFDHEGAEHGRTFYDEVMRVPLIVRVPGLAHGMTIEDQVAHVDVLPTALDLLGIPTDLFVQGRSLRPLLAGDSLPERPIGGEAAQTPGLNALRTNRWKYIVDPFGRRMLYDLDTDPHERTDLCARNPAPCAPFAADLEAWRARNAAARTRLGLPPARPAAIDEQTEGRLRALGYAE